MVFILRMDMDYEKMFAVYLTLCFARVTTVFGQDHINFCRATLSSFGEDGLYYESNEQGSGTKVDFTIQSPGYPEYYTGKSCVCTLTTSKDQDRVSFHYRFNLWRPTDKGCPSMLFIKYNGQGYSYCTDGLRPDGYTTHAHLHSGDTVKFYLANPKGYSVKSQIEVVGMVGEHTHLKCIEEKVELSDKACECKPKPPEFYMSHPEDSNNTRVLFGFLGLIAFGLLFGAAVLIWWCLRRRRRKKAEEEKISTHSRSSDTIARNSAFFADPEMPKNAHGIYAEIDFGTGIPFSPDPNLRLEMQGKNSTAKYTRGSVDSGLYSEMSDKGGGHTNSGFSPYSTLGPDEKYEPPASTSSPVLTPKSPKELEELYATPKKSKKSKKAKKSKKTPKLERQQSEEIYQHPPLPNRTWNVPISLEPTPNYHPDPRVKSGSRLSVASSQLSGHADLGKGYTLSSRSSLNECYVTDSRSTVNLNNSKGTMETDI